MFVFLSLKISPPERHRTKKTIRSQIGCGQYTNDTCMLVINHLWESQAYTWKFQRMFFSYYVVHMIVCQRGMCNFFFERILLSTVWMWIIVFMPFEGEAITLYDFISTHKFLAIENSSALFRSKQTSDLIKSRRERESERLKWMQMFHAWW